MQIKLIKPAMDRHIGSVLTVSDDHAKALIDKGYAVATAVEVRSKAIGRADTKANHTGGLSPRTVPVGA